MSDEDLKTLLPGDDDFERALDQSDHERAKRAIMADPHVRGTLAELREELRAGEMPFRYRPDAHATATPVERPRSDRPRSDRPEAMGPDSKRERDTVRGLGNPALQSTPPPPMVVEGADGDDGDELAAAYTEDRAPKSQPWSPNDAPTRADATVGGRTARLKAAEAPASSRTPTPAPVSDGDPDARSYQLATIDRPDTDGQDVTRADRRAAAAPAANAAQRTPLPSHADDGEREITGAGANSTSPWVAPVGPDGAERTPRPRNALEEKDTIRTMPAPRNRGLGALVAGACLACAFVAVIALATARHAPLETARAGITMPRAPAWQPPPEVTEPAPATPPAVPPATETPAVGEAATRPPPPPREPEPQAPSNAPAAPASSSDRWF